MARRTSFGTSSEKTNSRRNLLARSFSKSLRLDKNNPSDVHSAKQVLLHVNHGMDASVIRHLPSSLGFAFFAGSDSVQCALQSLFDATSKGDAAMIKRLLKKGTPPNAMDPDGDTPLLCAAQGMTPQSDLLMAV